MDILKRMKMKDLSSDDLFSFFNDYVKKVIMEDIEEIYEKDVRALDSEEEPWVFQLDR